MSTVAVANNSTSENATSSSQGYIAMPRATRNMVTLTVMISAIMVLLDMTIANVALPQMMGSLGVTSEQVTWVLTSYSMAEAIFIPLASYLALKMGIRKLLLVSVTGFIITSALCGQADSLTEMVFFRILQGAFGASVIPLSQSILVQIYPSNERGKAMALFSVGILLGPILGPTLGGVITENMDWRWIFYVNLPVGIVCLAMLYKFVKIDGSGKTSVDWPLVFGMVLGIGLLQMVLDRGNEVGWFDSQLILFSTIISLCAWFFFIARSWYTKGEIAPIWLLKDRNLAVSCLMMAGFSVAMFGISQQQPMMLEQLLGYPVQTTGFLMAPRGIAAAIVLLTLAPFIDRLDPRILVGIGLLLNAFGAYFMIKYSMNIDIKWILFPSIIQGAGMGLVFAPLSQLAYATLSKQNIIGGAVIFNLCRTIGSSFGISIINTYHSRVEQAQWHSLGGALSPTNPQLQQAAMLQDVNITDPGFIAQIAQQLQQQSSILAFVYTFSLIMFIYLALIPLIALFKRKKAT